jgi:hypothetical protein
MIRKILTIGILCLFVFSGCTALYKKEIPEAPIIPELKWDLDSSAEFVKQNMTEINARYSSNYVTYEFVVDTEYGSTVIQNLIDPGAASAITADSVKHSNPEYQDKLVTIYQYIIEDHDYILDPHTWQSVAETIRAKKGDCKSLSILLMSLLLSAGYDTYTGIANGHTQKHTNQDKNLPVPVCVCLWLFKKRGILSWTI